MVNNKPENKNANPQNNGRPKFSELKKWVITSLVVGILAGGMSYLGTCQASNRQFESSRYQAEYKYRSDAYSEFMTGIHQMYTTVIQYAEQSPFDTKTNTAPDPKEQTILQMIWGWTGSFYRLVPFIDEKVNRDSLRGNMTDYAHWLFDLRYGNESTNEEQMKKYQESENYFREDLLNELFP